MGRYLALALCVTIGLPGLALADWVRDEVQINMRTGPGTQYRITRVLRSGDPVTRLQSTAQWVKVRTAEGQDGWIPAGYTREEPPASLALPETRAKLRADLETTRPTNFLASRRPRRVSLMSMMWIWPRL